MYLYMKGLIPKLISFIVMKPFNPLESTRGLDNQIILAVVDHYVYIVLKEMLH